MIFPKSWEHAAGGKGLPRGLYSEALLTGAEGFCFLGKPKVEVQLEGVGRINQLSKQPGEASVAPQTFSLIPWGSWIIGHLPEFFSSPGTQLQVRII